MLKKGILLNAVSDSNGRMANRLSYTKKRSLLEIAINRKSSKTDDTFV